MFCSCPDFQCLNKPCKHLLAVCLHYSDEHKVGCKENSPNLLVNAVVSHLNGLPAIGGSIFPQLNFNVAKNTRQRAGAPGTRDTKRKRAYKKKLRSAAYQQKKEDAAAAADAAEAAEAAELDADDEAEDDEEDPSFNVDGIQAISLVRDENSKALSIKYLVQWEKSKGKSYKPTWEGPECFNTDCQELLEKLHKSIEDAHRLLLDTDEIMSAENVTYIAVRNSVLVGGNAV
jgi:SWIM zinc finger